MEDQDLVNRGKKWSDDEEAILKNLINENIEFENISKTLKRTKTGVLLRIYKMAHEEIDEINENKEIICKKYRIEEKKLNKYIEKEEFKEVRIEEFKEFKELKKNKIEEQDNNLKKIYEELKNQRKENEELKESINETNKKLLRIIKLLKKLNIEQDNDFEIIDL